MTIKLFYTSPEKDIVIDKTIKPEEYVVNKMTARFLHECKDDEDIIEELDKLLIDLDCSRILDCGKLTSVNTFKYNNLLSVYRYYFEQLSSNVIKTEYYNKLTKLMIDNEIFDKKYAEEHKNDNVKVKKKTNTKAKKKKLPLWVRRTTKDLFTNEDVYEYTNTKTLEVIKSTNPNLIEEELTVKKKKKPKATKVLTGKITLCFKMK